MGKILKIIAVIFLLFVILTAITGIIIYKFVPLKTISVCILDSNVSALPIQCETDATCKTIVKNAFFQNMSEMPGNLKEKINPIIEELAFCSQNFCRIKDVGIVGESFEGIKQIDSCTGKEIKIKLYGRELIDLMRLK